MKILRVTTVPQSLHQLLKPQLDYLKNDFEIITVAGPFDQENIDHFGKWKFKHYEIALSRKITPFKDVRAILQLYKIIKKEKIDIIHTHTPKAGLVGMLAGLLAGTKIRFHSVAGMPLVETVGLKKKVLIAFERLTYRLAHQVMPNSFGLLRYIIDKKLVPEGKLKVLANGATIGVDTDYFTRTPEIEKRAITVRSEINIAPGDFVCCYIGRLTKQKGVEELLNAFGRILPSNPKIKLILLGRYEQHLDPIEDRYIGEIESNAQIIHLGYKNDIRPYLAASDLFVFPSYREGMPNVVLQAGCFGLPCIVTDIPGSNEIIKDGYNGLIVNTKSADELFKAVNYLIENAEIRKSMGSYARNEVHRKYDREIILEELKKEYYRWIHEKNM
ncbi:MAG: glycosyltransferase family 4 protein [Ferruginibacter sp.]